MRSVADRALLRALAAEVKALRGALRISQEELAHRADLSRTFIGRIEVGSSQLSFTGIVALARALEVEPDVFVRSTLQRQAHELAASK